ncbi:MAG TPA: M48 family metallopeptidase [Thermoanaerobaculia bacterium]|nr:M48 family metallopeptidase [Thermoanaerobaculia bacterium]
MKRTLLFGAILLMAMTASSYAQATTTAAAPATQTAPAPAAKPASRFEVKISPEMLKHSYIEEALYFVEWIYDVAVLLILLATGLSKHMRDLAARMVRRPFVLAMIYFALYLVASAILEFPLTYYADYVVPHKFNLTTQSFGSWMSDMGKGLGVSLILGSLLTALALWGIRSVKRWWLALWIGSIPVIIFLIVITPIFIDPIFNRFVPLKDAVLKQQLLDEASRAGIEGSRVYQVDKSKQTTTMNAYVTGMGPSKRIVLWDTLIAKLTHEEILTVMGHEMGHYVLNHLWKALAFALTIALFVFFAGQRIVDWGVARYGPRWGFEQAGDPAALPWLLLTLSILTFILSPVMSGFSRHLEHQADMFGLELTHGNAAMATAFIKFAEDSKADPRPNELLEWWHHSHPTLGRRIDFVLGYKPWEKGQPNELWKPKS